MYLDILESARSKKDVRVGVLLIDLESLSQSGADAYHQLCRVQTYFDDKCYKVGFVVFPFLYWFYFFLTLHVFWTNGGIVEGVGSGTIVRFE